MYKGDRGVGGGGGRVGAGESCDLQNSELQNSIQSLQIANVFYIRLRSYGDHPRLTTIVETSLEVSNG